MNSVSIYFSKITIELKLSTTKVVIKMEKDMKHKNKFEALLQENKVWWKFATQQFTF